MPEKNPKFMLGVKNLAMLPSFFDYAFVHLKQKVGLRPELSPKFLSTLGPNPTRKARPDLKFCHAEIFYIITLFAVGKCKCTVQAETSDNFSTPKIRTEAKNLDQLKKVKGSFQSILLSWKQIYTKRVKVAEKRKYCYLQ